MGPEEGDSPRKKAAMQELLKEIRSEPRTIFTTKVYVSLDHMSDSRVIGWRSSLADAITDLNNFGDECRWLYAIIEEFYEGFHPQTKSVTWLSYADGWEQFTPTPTSFVRCINHAIG